MCSSDLGGSFLGVFHIGVLVALRELGIRPDIYAGASVGTMFSMLMHGGLQAGQLDPRLIRRMFDVDKWADHDDHAPPGQPVGRADRLVRAIALRTTHPDAKRLLALSPGRIFDLLVHKGISEARAELDRGLAALLFPGFSREEGLSIPPMDPAEAGRFAEEGLAAVTAGDLPGMLRFGDRVMAHLGVYVPGHEDDGQLIGFDETARLIQAFAFPDADKPPTLAAHGGRGAHFLFSATNHTTGGPEFFGGEPTGDDPGSPDALQAVLAASSLPLAFRRRSREEVFGPGVPRPDVRYTDGGIFDNFPVDSALKYLRYLSQFPEYRWLEQREVRMVLLPLEFPAASATDARELEGCLRTALLAWSQSEMQKLRRVLSQQALVRRLAPAANEALRYGRGDGPGPRLAVRSDFDIVAPARQVYAHPFAFKSWLGFRADRQAELMAAGCRRARYAFLFRTWREAREADKQKAKLEEFDKTVRGELRGARGRGHACVLGSLNPKPCAFLAIEPELGPTVQKCCVASAHKDLPPEELPATSRVDAWVKLIGDPD